MAAPFKSRRGSSCHCWAGEFLPPLKGTIISETRLSPTMRLAIVREKTRKATRVAPKPPEGEGEHRESRQDRTATTDADGVVAETGGVLITE